MSIIITTRKSIKGDKVYYQFEWGKSAGQRVSTGIFTYTKPKNAIEKNHNKEAFMILDSKRSKMILERQSIASGYVPMHKIKSNFLDFYADYVKHNVRYGSRHLMASYKHFKAFLKIDFISAASISETLCENYRAYLLSKYNGETPANYFREFKRVMKAGKKAGYFTENPAAEIASKTKPNRKKKEVVEPEEYLQLLKTPCLNYEVRNAFIFCLYAGLRWCDIKTLKWDNIQTESILLVQQKTKVTVEIPLHPIAKAILGQRKRGLLFRLPTANGANKILQEWTTAAGVIKHITWHCARLSFSVLLQDEGINTATVAGMLGHTSSKMVEVTYQRYRIQVGKKAIQKLPSPES